MLQISALVAVGALLILWTPALATTQEGPRLEGTGVLEGARAGDRLIANPAPGIYVHNAFVDAQSTSDPDFVKCRRIDVGPLPR